MLDREFFVVRTISFKVSKASRAPRFWLSPVKMCFFSLIIIFIFFQVGSHCSDRCHHTSSTLRVWKGNIFPGVSGSMLTCDATALWWVCHFETVCGLANFGTALQSEYKLKLEGWIVSYILPWLQGVMLETHEEEFPSWLLYVNNSVYLWKHGRIFCY